MEYDFDFDIEFYACLFTYDKWLLCNDYYFSIFVIEDLTIVAIDFRYVICYTFDIALCFTFIFFQDDKHGPAMLIS